MSTIELSQHERTVDSGRRRFLWLLAGIFMIEWIALAITPFDRQDWALENLLVVVFALFGIAMRHRRPLSKPSAALIFAFLVLHALGAHYTYSNVPYVQWGERLLGIDINAVLGWQRNHFDRLVHFCYGLLFVYPLREVCLRYDNVRGVVAFVLPVTLLISGSVIYELIEWAAALLFGGDLGVAYLGTQGDPWDAQKDMALATGGALVATLLVIVCERRHT